MHLSSLIVFHCLTQSLNLGEVTIFLDTSMLQTFTVNFDEPLFGIQLQTDAINENLMSNCKRHEQMKSTQNVNLLLRN